MTRWRVWKAAEQTLDLLVDRLVGEDVVVVQHQRIRLVGDCQRVDSQRHFDRTIPKRPQRRQKFHGSPRAPPRPGPTKRTSRTAPVRRRPHRATATRRGHGTSSRGPTPPAASIRLIPLEHHGAETRVGFLLQAVPQPRWAATVEGSAGASNFAGATAGSRHCASPALSE